jgi:hypothetical protein
MSRAEIARKFAVAAREAEHGGKHRRAAELYVEALRVLLDKPPSGDESGFDSEPPPAPSSVPPRNTMVRLSQNAASNTTGANAGDASPLSGGEPEDDAHLPRVG